MAALGIAQAGSTQLTASQAWLCPHFNNFGCSQHSPSKLGSALVCAKFAQNLCLASYSSNLFLERKELLEGPLIPFVHSPWV
jgi:hypothetical protein